MDLGSTLKRQVLGVNSQEGIYRAAFPAFRVFIYGQEVSGDVVDVRVNQSGGSMDRSPSTCTISLVNVGDKYILDRLDIQVVSTSRNDLVNKLKSNVEMYLGTALHSEDGTNEDVDVPGEFFRFLKNSDQFESLGINIDSFYKEATSTTSNWDESYIPDSIKLNVMKKKIPEVMPGWDKLKPILEGDELYKNIFGDERYVKYVYPLSEGACIFHPNDPVRVAFRDPFEPNIWYWMFSGFVDGFSEDTGVNNESIVTVSSTDVTKIARYSSVQLNTNAVRDPKMTSLFPVFDGAASLKWIPSAEIFKNFNIFEVLEILFFGLDSFKNTLSYTTLQALSNLSDDEANIYLQYQNPTGPSDISTVENLQLETKYKSIKARLEDTKVSRFEGSNIPPLSNPRGTVRFTPASDNVGVHAIYIGTPNFSELNFLEKSTDGVFIDPNNLSALNDLLSHRVTLEDPSKMGKDFTAQSFMPPTGDISDLIGHIGRNEDQYPVGAGGVYYIAPTGFSYGVSGGALNAAYTSGSSDLHSEFLDRLTFFYNIAENVQFCFYATPRGDVVFEMPFYDFDPWAFSGISSDNRNADLDEATRIARESLKDWAENSEKYSTDDIYTMMQAYSDLSLDSEGFKSPGVTYFDYGRYFTVERHETYGFSNAVHDSGLKTVGLCTKNQIENRGDLTNLSLSDTQFVVAPDLAALLGLRTASNKAPWMFVTSDEISKLVAAVDLRRANSEAHTIGLQTLPKFGLMVNRPLYWRRRNCVGNIVSCQHSISVNSSCETQINLNYVRTWKGEMAGTSEVFRHFGGDFPFSYADLVLPKKPHSSIAQAPTGANTGDGGFGFQSAIDIGR